MLGLQPLAPHHELRVRLDPQVRVVAHPRMPARNAVAADYVVVALRGRLAKVRRGHRRPTAAGLRLLDPLLGLEVLLGDPVARRPELGDRGSPELIGRPAQLDDRYAEVSSERVAAAISSNIALAVSTTPSEPFEDAAFFRSSSRSLPPSTSARRNAASG